jgi:hypothetical protein
MADSTLPKVKAGFVVVPLNTLHTVTALRLLLPPLQLLVWLMVAALNKTGHLGQLNPVPRGM